MDYAIVKLRKRKVPVKYEDVSIKKVQSNVCFNYNNYENGKVLKLPDNIYNGAMVRVKTIHSEESLEPITMTYNDLIVKKKQLMMKGMKRMEKQPHIVNKGKKKISKSTTKTKVLCHVGRPTVEECMYVTEALAALHPQVVDRNDELRRRTMLESCGMRHSVTEAIVSTMLSQNTTDANSKAAYAKMKRTFGQQQRNNNNNNNKTVVINWDDVAHPDNLMKLEDSIRVAGLAKTRSIRIQTMLQMVQAEHNGSSSMEYLREWTDDRIKKELSRFPGLGPKTISCVLLFALNRPEFPVDTHVLRICQLMGWLSSSHNRITAYEHLNATVPNDIKMDLHCLLVAHGKHCHHCAANHRPQFPPPDGTKLPCPLKNISKWKGLLPTSSKASTIQLEPILSLATIETTKSTNVNHHRSSLTTPKIKLEPITPDAVISSAITHPPHNTLQIKKEENN